MIALRDYQAAAIDAVVEALATDMSTVVAASVGAGKTLVQAGLFKRVMDESGGAARCLSLAHTRELVQQNAAAMARLWPGAPIGINAAALGRRDERSPIIFASIQSVWKLGREIGPFDIISIDECDLLPPDATSQYGTLLRVLFEMNPDARLVGLSGTPFRLNSGWLHRGKSATFDSICFEIGIPELIDRGFLVPPVNRGTAAAFSSEGLKVRGGEYVAHDLQERMKDASTTARAVAEMVEVGTAQGRKSWLAFCAGIEHAYATRDAVRALGITCETVEGVMSGDERSRILKDYQAGRIRCLTNVNVLSVGYDFPGIDLIALMRMTKSARLYIQQVGRGLRCLGANAEESAANGKPNVLVMDFAGLIDSLGPVDQPMISNPKNPDKFEPSPPPMRTCPECLCKALAAAISCPECEYVFERKTADDKISAKPSESAILSDPKGWHTVKSVVPSRHGKFGGGTPTLRVEFMCGARSYSDFVCFEHPVGSFPQRKAAAWWIARGGDTLIPSTIDEALDRFEELAEVGSIRVIRDGQYWKVISYKDKPPRTASTKYDGAEWGDLLASFDGGFT